MQQSNKQPKAPVTQRVSEELSVRGRGKTGSAGHGNIGRYFGTKAGVRSKAKRDAGKLERRFLDRILLDEVEEAMFEMERSSTAQTTMPPLTLIGNPVTVIRRQKIDPFHRAIFTLDQLAA